MSDYETFPGHSFKEEKFWTGKIKSNILDELSEFDKKNKIEFLDNIINYCQNLKSDLTTEWEYLIYDNWNDVPYKTYSNKSDAEEKLEELIYGNNSDHVHWEIKKIKPKER